MPSLIFSQCQQRAPRAEWLHVVAAYLVAIFLLQGMAAAVQWGAGPLHRHRDTPVTLATLPFTHTDHAHAHAHASAERHHHEAAVHSVVATAESGTSDNLTSALCSALTLLAVDQARFWAAFVAKGRHVQQAAPAWARHAAPAQSVYRPPWLA